MESGSHQILATAASGHAISVAHNATVLIRHAPSFPLSQFVYQNRDCPIDQIMMYLTACIPQTCPPSFQLEGLAWRKCCPWLLQYLPLMLNTVPSSTTPAFCWFQECKRDLVAEIRTDPEALPHLFVECDCVGTKLSRSMS